MGSLFNSFLGRSTLIADDDVWGLLFILFGSVAVAIFLEQRYAWASRISGVIIVLLFALVLSDFSIIPADCVLYNDIIWDYAVPLGIPLLLLQCNMKRIWKDTGRMLVIFLIGAVGTVVGAFGAYALLHNYVPEPGGVAAMMTGSYIGGSVNLASLAAQFKISAETISSTTVADNFLMALYFIVLIFIARTSFFRKLYGHPHIDEVESAASEESGTQAAAYWTRREISLKDIAVNLTYSATVVFAAKLIGEFLTEVIPVSSPVLIMCNTFFGSRYIWITTLAMIFATFFEDKAQNMNGSQEIGTYFIYLFLFVIGVPASIVQIILNAPLLLVFTAIMVACNMIFSFVGGKILKYDLEEIILASNANIGGPTTAAGMGISQGWSKLIGPAMLIGTLGYVIGTYLGVVVGSLLGV